MTDYHKKIYNDFMYLLEKGKLDMHVDMKNMTYDEFDSYVFYPKSYRLKFTGLSLLKSMYQCWSWKINCQELFYKTGRYVLFLSKNVKVPYYWDSVDFFIFSQEKALEIEMAGGDIKYWIQLFE